ncbi:hypothetical protein D3C71_1942720 [compost metagenome]
MTIDIQAVDQLVRGADFDDLPQTLQYRAELLEHKVVAVLRAAKVLHDVTFVGFRMNDDQHGAVPATAAADANLLWVVGIGSKNSFNRCCTTAKLQ